MIVGNISNTQKDQLLKVIPSKDYLIEYRPCQVILKNGTCLDNVYLQEVTTYLKTWGSLIAEGSNKKFVLIEDIVEIKDSPNRLPPILANKIYKAGESGMGYCLFKLIFDNGKSLSVGVGNAVDFIPLPLGLTTRNIKDVVPHLASRKNYLEGPEYFWCLFNGHIPNFYNDLIQEGEINRAEKTSEKNILKWWCKLLRFK